MSLILALIAAGSTAVAGGAVLVRGWLRRRAVARAHAGTTEAAVGTARAGRAASPGRAGANGARRPAEGEIGVGDVIQVEDATRWLGSGMRLREAGTLRCSLWFATEGQVQSAVASFPPPADHVYWLTAQEPALPAEPPSRLELDGALLDRSECFPVELEGVGSEPPELGPRVLAAIYQGPGSQAAIVLGGSLRSLVFAGRRIDASGYDRLGRVDPAES
jgi:hypothetical protein